MHRRELAWEDVKSGRGRLNKAFTKVSPSPL